MRKTQLWTGLTICIASIWLAATALVLVPLIGPMAAINRDRSRVEHRLDYPSIRIAATGLRGRRGDGFVEPSVWPLELTEISPNSVAIRGDDVWIEYGSGFGHYGLLVTTDADLGEAILGNDAFSKLHQVSDSVFYYECE